MLPIRGRIRLKTRLSLEVSAMLFSGHEPIDKEAERHEVAIACQGVPGWEEPTRVTGRSSQRFLSIRGGNILTMIVIVAAVTALTRFATHMTRQPQECEPVDATSAGIIVRSELLRLWLPRTLAELAKRQAQSPFVRTRDDLQQFLDLQHQQDLWYALTIRAYEVNGIFSDVTYIRKAGDSLYFRELLDILATAAGNPPYSPTSDLSRASVHVIADQFMKGEPREVMAELLAYPAPTADRERSP
jgi:hypothetical protein